MTNTFNFLSICLLKARNHMVEIEQPLVSRRQRILKCATQTSSILIESSWEENTCLCSREEKMTQILCDQQKNKSLQKILSQVPIKRVLYILLLFVCLLQDAKTLRDHVRRNPSRKALCQQLSLSFVCYFKGLFKSCFIIYYLNYKLVVPQ